MWCRDYCLHQSLGSACITYVVNGFERLPVLSRITNNPCRHSGNYRIVGNISSHNGTSANQGELANSNAAHNGGIAADGYLVFHYGSHQLPVFFCLQLAAFADGPWVLVVDKHHAVPDEYAITYVDALADEGVTGDLAPGADGHALLYLNKCTNSAFGFYDAAIQIHQVRVENLHAFAEDYIFCNHPIIRLLYVFGII
jgi:hypothetical protein